LVVAAWSAVQVTGRADAAGTLLLLSTVASLLLSPILGAMIDFVTQKKAMLLVSHLGIAFAGATPFLAKAIIADGARFASIAAAVVLATVFSVVLGGAMDYFLKTHLARSDRPRQLATLNSTTQIALIAGTAFDGLIVAQVEHSYAFRAGFALVRIRSETRFLAECPRHLLGRFRANSSLVTNSVGSLIFATPTLYGGVSVSVLYVLMAGAVALSAIGLLLMTKQARGA
jgi:hypothetical protein